MRAIEAMPCEVFGPEENSDGGRKARRSPIHSSPTSPPHPPISFSGILRVECVLARTLKKIASGQIFSGKWAGGSGKMGRNFLFTPRWGAIGYGELGAVAA